MKKIIFSLIISILILPSISFAHPGRTDSSGGHTCRTNCTSWGLSTGEYHYHRSKGLPQAKEPVRSIRNEGGVGQTVPAPEYKIQTNTVNTPTINTTPRANTIVPIPKTEPPVVSENKIQPKDIIKTEEIKNNNTDIPAQTIRQIEKSTQTEKKSWIVRFFNWFF